MSRRQQVRALLIHRAMLPVPHRRTALVIALALSSLPGCGSDDDGLATCAHFRFQEDAQAYYQRHGATQLDPDGDGIACADLPRSGTATAPAAATRR